jgi:CRISPR-associated endonuclease/helicase Cas3
MTSGSQDGSGPPSSEDFRQFYIDVHHRSPFPWQEALLARVAEKGWPELIDVPTGLGKTAVLDVAVFLSAMRCEHARRRVFLVVDRRLIVDQAHDEAIKICQALDTAGHGTVCGRVRQELTIAGDDSTSVLDVTRMRGGLNWSWLWIERPDRHAIITGTVDQIGSRLLFRGYGVGERLRPIDAALVGTDSLIIVDEAHLSDPFLATLRDALSMNAGAVGARPIIVAMSASPEGIDHDVHGITAADESDPVAGKRLRAPKSMHAVSVASPAASAAAATADALAYWARQLGGPGKVTGVVVNTVGMARAVFERLKAEGPAQSECVLLTGRVRPIDREYLLASWYPKIRSFVERDPDAELYVVATQTIEAGADVDFDGLVTQAASLSATVQRLGRLNRLGDRAQSHAVVVHADKLTDPVYGSASYETWNWLTSHVEPSTHKKGLALTDLGELDASPAALRARVTAIPAARQVSMRGARPYIPVLSDSSLSVWVRTSPTPHPDVPVAPYLHGIGAGEPSVSLVWREDLQGDDPRNWTASVERLPPNASEVIEISVGALRRWLATVDDSSGAPRSRLDLGLSDLESQPPEDDPADSSSSSPRRSLLRFRGADKSDPVSAQEARPGDLLVVPSRWGGCDRYGWNPGSRTDVIDVADFAGGGRRGAVIRIGRPLIKAVSELANELATQIEEFVGQVTADIEDEAASNAIYRAQLGEIISDEVGDLPHMRVLRRLARDGELVELDGDQDSGQIKSNEAGPVRALFAARSAAWNDDDSAPGSSASRSTKRITLVAHQRAVGSRAVEFATNLGLPAELSHAAHLAALLHDEGKRDDRFQLMLHRGDRWLAEEAKAANRPLAKSGMNPADRAAWRRAFLASGYPPGMRHEAFSARIAEILLDRGAGACKDADGKYDKELVVHLVSAHHGYGRPLLPPLTDPAPCEIVVPNISAVPVAISTANTVDWKGPDRFARLCDKYGYWGLALLETVVRLADIWCSARSEGCDDSDS